MRSLLLLSILLACFTHKAYAANGSALIPHFTSYSSGSFESYFYLSNITNQEVEVSVTFFNNQGTLITDNNAINSGHIRAYNVIDYVEPASGKTATFKIPPRGTATIRVMSSLNTEGYGKIRWEQADSERRRAMLAFGKFFRNAAGLEHSASITINNGRSF